MSEQRNGDSRWRLLLGNAGSSSGRRAGRDFDARGLHGRRRANATYRHHGTHAEAIEIIFDPVRSAIARSLEFFFQIHDPTTVNRQGNDRGHELSLGNLLRRRRTDARRRRHDRRRRCVRSVAGQSRDRSAPAGPFWEAEPEHQDYLERYPNGYTCHFPRPDWVLPRRSESAGQVSNS